MDFDRHESNADVRLDKAFFPVGKLVGLKFMLMAVSCLRQAAGSPAFNVPFPIGPLPFQLLGSGLLL